jgi:hypothetical protein
VTPEQFDGFANRLNALERRVDVLATELGPVKDWMRQSQEFHIETRRNWDTFKGKQDAEAERQAERHEQNQQSMTRMANRIAIAMVIITFVMAMGTYLGILVAYQAGKKNVSFEKLMSSGFDSVYAQSNDSANPPY